LSWFPLPGGEGRHHEVVRESSRWSKRLAKTTGSGVRKPRTPEGVPERRQSTMGSTFFSLHYHLVFSTKERRPLIRAEWRSSLHSYLGGIIRGMNGVAESVGGVSDHVHLLVSLRPTHAAYPSCQANDRSKVSLAQVAESFFKSRITSAMRILGKSWGNRQRPRIYCESGGAPSKVFISMSRTICSARRE
jgi:REP element-mobilizing transposase RayT